MKKYILYFLVILSAFTSCKSTNSLKPACSGKAYELLAIMNKTQWETSLGDSIKSTFMTSMDVLPQDEPTFKVFSVSMNNFGSQLKTHRNILELKIDRSKKTSGIFIKRDFMAKQQVYVRVVSPSEKEFLAFFEINKQKLMDIFLEAEIDRSMYYFAKYTDTKIFNHMKKNYSYSLRVPAGYNINKDTLGFVWISQETPKNSRGLFIYSCDYNSEKQFSVDSIIARRNALLKKFVPGPLPKSYMTTALSMDFVSNKIEQDSCYAIETRGLWMVEGDFMGGPFINISMLSPDKKKIVCIDGYVYAPSEYKRIIIRQVEAVMKTFSFVKEVPKK